LLDSNHIKACRDMQSKCWDHKCRIPRFCRIFSHRKRTLEVPHPRQWCNCKDDLYSPPSGALMVGISCKRMFRKGRISMGSRPISYTNNRSPCSWIPWDYASQGGRIVVQSASRDYQCPSSDWRNILNRVWCDIPHQQQIPRALYKFCTLLVQCPPIEKTATCVFWCKCCSTALSSACIPYSTSLRTCHKSGQATDCTHNVRIPQFLLRLDNSKCVLFGIPDTYSMLLSPPEFQEGCECSFHRLRSCIWHRRRYPHRLDRFVDHTCRKYRLNRDWAYS